MRCTLWSELHERPAHAGLLGDDRGAGRCLPPDLSGQFPGLVLVAGADEEELPAPHDRPAFVFQRARQRDRLAVRAELNPDLPLGDPRGHGLGGLGVLKPLVLRLALGFGLRHRDVRVLPLLLNGMPAVQGGLRRNAMPGQHVAGDPLSVPGGGLGACVQEDLPVIRADGDAAADLAADVFFHRTQGKGPLRLSGLRLVAHGDGDAPVITVCHGMTLTHLSPALGRAADGFAGVGQRLAAGNGGCRRSRRLGAGWPSLAGLRADHRHRFALCTIKEQERRTLMAVMTARQASTPAVEVPAGERGGTKPGGHEQLWSTVLGLGIPAASFLLAWGLHGSTASTYRIDSQWSALTGLFVLALAIERALEPFSRKLGPDTTKRKDARGQAPCRSARV